MARGPVRRGERGRVGGALVLWWIATTAGSVVWLQGHLAETPPKWDQASYLLLGLRFFRAFSERGLLALVAEFQGASPSVAPLFPLTTLPLHSLLGETRVVAHLTSLAYLALLVAGTYSLGRTLFGAVAGALAAFLASTFTGIVQASRDYMTDLPAVGFLTLGIYGLARSQDFRDRRWSLAFGACAGLTLLTKTMAGVFFAGPVVYALLRASREARRTSALANAALAGGAAALVASVWWGPNFRSALSYLVHYGFGEGAAPYAAGGPGLFSLRNLGYYPLALFNDGVGALEASVLLLLACMAARRPSATATGSGLLWTWLLAGLAILTFVPNKGGSHYLLALLPALALLVAGALAPADPSRAKRGLLALALVAGAFNYASLTWESRLLPRLYFVPPLTVLRSAEPAPRGEWPIRPVLEALARLRREEPVERDLAIVKSMAEDRELPREDFVRSAYRVLLKREPDAPGLRAYVGALERGAMTREEVAEEMAGSAERRERPAKVLVLPDHAAFNAATLQYEAERDRLRLLFSHAPGGAPEGEGLAGYDAFVVKDGGEQGPLETTRGAAGLAARLRQGGLGARAASFGCPDGSRIEVFGPEPGAGNGKG